MKTQIKCFKPSRKYYNCDRKLLVGEGVIEQLMRRLNYEEQEFYIYIYNTKRYLENLLAKQTKKNLVQTRKQIKN